MMSIPTLIFALVVLAVLPQRLWILILVMAVLDSTRVFRLPGRGDGHCRAGRGRPPARRGPADHPARAAAERGLSAWPSSGCVSARCSCPHCPSSGSMATADWGGMVKDNKDGIIFGVSAALIPGAAIAGLAICVNLVVDWLLRRTSSLKGGRGDG